VITDIVMPEMDGLEVVTALREKHPSVKIIAISGADSGDYLDSARLIGAAKVLRKPFAGDVLMAAINDLLPGATLNCVGNGQLRRCRVSGNQLLGAGTQIAPVSGTEGRFPCRNLYLRRVLPVS
jgi:DNA-binding NarL/FixJ family response regulator